MDQKRGFVLLGVYLIVVIVVELLVFNRNSFIHEFSGIEQRRLVVENGILTQLEYKNGKLISQGINPSITFENLNIEIQSIFIGCKNTVLGASGRVFYKSDDQSFLPQNSVMYPYVRVSGYKNILVLPKKLFVSDLRIGLSNIDGDILICQDFIVNPSQEFNLNSARLVLYTCLLALGLITFSNGINRPQSHMSGLYPAFLPDWIWSEGIFSSRSQIGSKFLPLIWLLLWLLPWATWLDALPWLRTALSLLLFLTPGLTLSLLLARDRFSLPAHFSSGLALSVFWVGALGFTGRVFHWPFEYLKILFALSGLIVLLVLLRYSTSNRPLYKPTGWSGRTLILLLFMIAFGILANFQSRHSGDDLSYLAYLTTWQHAEQLDFREVIYGVGTADSIRFWWGMFPMSLALLAELSHLHGLLLVGFYLEPFLVTFALLAIYALYEDLLPSQDQAITALLLQFTFLFLLRQGFQPGYMFFERLSDDKVFAAFVLAPVFFLALRYLLGSFHWRSGLLFLLLGSSLALTHPIILAYSVFIAGVCAVIETIRNKEYARLGIITLLLLLILVPSASLRFVDEAWVVRNLLDLEPGVIMPDNFSLDTARESAGLEELIHAIDGTPFYGFDLDRIRIVANSVPQHPLTILLSWSYLWILGIGFLWSLFNLRKDNAAPFIAASSLLVLLCAIPYTGWLVGYFVSARMLWRSPWLLPIGLISLILLKEFSNWIKGKISTGIQSRVRNGLHIWIPVACMILVAWFSEFVYQYQWLSTKEQLNDYRNNISSLSELGNYIENHIDQQSRFLAPIELMNYLPGLSSKSKVVLMRNTAWAPYPIDVNEIADVFTSDPGITIGQRVEILDKYNVHYILSDEASIKDYYVRNHSMFDEQAFDDYWILGFRK